MGTPIVTSNVSKFALIIASLISTANEDQITWLLHVLRISCLKTNRTSVKFFDASLYCCLVAEQEPHSHSHSVSFCFDVKCRNEANKILPLLVKYQNTKKVIV